MVLDCAFYSIITRSSTSLLTKMVTITINTILPMRNTFVYHFSIKIRAWGFDELLESIFCILLVVEVSSW